MQYLIEPPNSWHNKEETNIEENVYFNVLSKFKDSDIVFEIIKKNGEIKKLNKKKCINLTTNFASEIKNIIKNTNENNGNSKCF